MNSYWYLLHIGETPTGENNSFDICRFYYEQIRPTIRDGRNKQEILLKTCRFVSEDVRENLILYLNRSDDQIAALLEMVANFVFSRPEMIEKLVGREALIRIREMTDYEEIINYLVGLLDSYE